MLCLWMNKFDRRMHTLSNFFSPLDCQEVSLCQARLLCYFDILNWNLYFWISLDHVASHNWEKSGVLLGFCWINFKGNWWPNSLAKGTCSMVAETRYSSSKAFFKAIHVDACANWYMSTYPSAGDIVWHLSYWTTQDIKNWLSRKIFFAFYVIFFLLV